MNHIKSTILTEKSNLLMEKDIYTFKVDQKANKIEIKKEIESIFGVKVKKVNILNYKGKLKRKMYAKGKFGTGIGNKYKKAIVTLQPGNSINIYDFEV